MGESVESYRMDLEGEINRWSGFARALRNRVRTEFIHDYLQFQRA